MRNLLYILWFSCAGLLYSCYADKGHYDYSEINEVQIFGLPAETLRKFKDADSLQIQPTLEGSLTKGEDAYAYTWKAVLQEGKVDDAFEFTIGHEKDLNYFVELPIGKYWIYLNVLDKTTDVTWRSGFELIVSYATSEGWMVLSDQDGDARLDMVSLAGNHELMVWDLLKNYEMPHKHGPQRILMNISYTSSSSITEDKILLMTRTGTTYLDPETLTWDPAFDLSLEMGRVPPGFTPTAVASISPYEWNYTRHVLLTTEEVYSRNVGSGYIYELPKNNIPGENKTFKVAPFVITNVEWYPYQWEPPVLLYDTDNKRFVQLDLAWNGTGCWIPTVADEVFPMVTNKDFVYATNTRQNSSSSFVLLRDDQEKIWLHGFGNLSRNKFTQLANYYYPIEAPNIQKANLFAVHTYFYFLFYVANNQIYQFDMVSKETRQLSPVDENGQPVSFAGEEITFIKFNPLQHGSKGDVAGYGQHEYRLIVGSDKGGENGGTVRMFNIKERLHEPVVLHREYTGFGKPVDITLRERK